MSGEDLTKNVLDYHEKRLGDLDIKQGELTRTVQSVERELRNVLERINHGVSPTMQKVLEKQNATEMSIERLDHKFEIAILKVGESIDKQLSDLRIQVGDQKAWFDSIKSVFIKGVVVVLAGAITLTVWNKVTSKEPRAAIITNEK